MSIFSGVGVRSIVVGSILSPCESIEAELRKRLGFLQDQRGDVFAEGGGELESVSGAASSGAPRRTTQFENYTAS